MSQIISIFTPLFSTLLPIFQQLGENSGEVLRRVLAFDPNSPLLFTQLQFWIFFALVFTGFTLITARCYRWQQALRNAYLFLVSLFFYFKTSGYFVGLLILVTCTDYLIARGIYSQREKARWRSRILLALSVTIDLGLLCYFKYSYFFVDMLNQLLGTNLQVSNIAAEAANRLTHSQFWSVDRIILPVGISFYTFQVISYTVDVYKGLVRPVRNILDFGFYVSFFPQLVAGPIVKASDFIPQLYRRYFLGRMQFGIAVFWILNGLAKKIILSDYLAVNFIDRVFANPHFFSGFENLMALFVYSLQVYTDFSGYTDIAIGLSMLMGFHLPMNFNSPYKAPNCSNFWKRWHISLSRWLQTYLYIPLGGNRNVTGATYFWITVITLFTLILSGSVWLAALAAFVLLSTIWTAYRRPEKRRHIYANLNAMITMVLGGLWHGASCNFLVWGGLNGAGMIVFKFWRDFSLLRRALCATLVTFVLILLAHFAPAALWNVLLVFVAFICLSAWVRWAFRGVSSPVFPWVGRAWSIAVTFTFITFTRLFFRSGSNLDPAVANETAWRIATEMIEAIGTRWSVNVLDVCAAYRNVFLLFLAGMIIHWLPTDLKRRYRLSFARLPLPVIGLAVLATVFMLYQFVTAEMQPFIYFQF
ncbi:MAG: MBOAT family protein [Bacteroidaceae bacterium]|nr:MBOAT family protein [Bacteroidaceae bacterium]